MTSIVSGIFNTVGSIFSGNSKKKASKDAQATLDAAVAKSVDATNHANDIEQQNLQPYRDAGQIGLDKLSSGMKDGSLTKTFGLSDFQEDPGYQFRLSEGQKQIDRAANAEGSSYSGRQLQAGAEYGQNLATQEYAAARDRFNQDRDQAYNKDMGLSSLGYGATVSANSDQAANTNNLVNLYTGQGSYDANARLQRGNISAATTKSIFDNLGTMASDVATSFLPGGGSLASLFKKGGGGGSGISYGQGALSW